MRNSLVPRVLLTAMLSACAAVAGAASLILSYPSATTVSGCGLVYTADRQYVWPCVLYRNGFDPR